MKNIFFVILTALLALYNYSCNLSTSNIYINFSPDVVTTKPGKNVTFIYNLSIDKASKTQLGQMFIYDNHGRVLDSNNYAGFYEITDSVIYQVPLNATSDSIYYIYYRAVNSDASSMTSGSSVIYINDSLKCL